MEAYGIDVGQTPPQRACLLISGACDTITGGVGTFTGWSDESAEGKEAKPTTQESVFGVRRNKQKQGRSSEV